MYILSQFKKSILEKKKGLQLSFYLKKLEEKSRRNPKSKIYDKYQRRNQWNRKQTIQNHNQFPEVKMVKPPAARREQGFCCPLRPSSHCPL